MPLDPADYVSEGSCCGDASFAALTTCLTVCSVWVDTESKIMKTVASSAGSVIVVVLSGVGGIGKTVFARHLARKLFAAEWRDFLVEHTVASQREDDVKTANRDAAGRLESYDEVRVMCDLVNTCVGQFIPSVSRQDPALVAQRCRNLFTGRSGAFLLDNALMTPEVLNDWVTFLVNARPERCVVIITTHDNDASLRIRSVPVHPYQLDFIKHPAVCKSAVSAIIRSEAAIRSVQPRVGCTDSESQRMILMTGGLMLSIRLIALLLVRAPAHRSIVSRRISSTFRPFLIVTCAVGRIGRTRHHTAATLWTGT